MAIALGILFSDTELRKDIVQHVFRRDLTRDLSQEVQAAPDIQRKEVAAEILSQSVPDILQGLIDLLQAGIMPCIRNDCTLGPEFSTKRPLVKLRPPLHRTGRPACETGRVYPARLPEWQTGSYAGGSRGRSHCQPEQCRT